MLFGAITVKRSGFGPEITWHQRASLDDVETLVEYSTDLIAWHREGVALDDADPVNGTQRFTARVTGEAGLEATLYLRIRWNYLP